MFVFRQKVLFKHCDPAGIVFYPRYVEMVNDCVEAFFDEVLDWPFHRLLTTGGVPTAEMQVSFDRTSRHGDDLIFRLTPERLGRSSFDYRLMVACGEERRLTLRATLVHVDLDGRPTPWPGDIRDKLDQMRKEAVQC